MTQWDLLRQWLDYFWQMNAWNKDLYFNDLHARNSYPKTRSKEPYHTEYPIMGLYSWTLEGASIPHPIRTFEEWKKHHGYELQDM